MTLALASRRAALLPGRWVSNELWRRARAVPSLDLRFAESKSLIDAVSGQQLITFSRASGGTFVNSAGQIEIVAENVPRFTHDPVTLESLGLLVEEQRTNSIRNNTMMGAVAGTPGTFPTNWAAGAAIGFSAEVVGVGSLNGINYIDVRVSGTAGNTNLALNLAFESNVIATTQGQAWTESVWIARVAGSTTNINSLSLNLTERNTSGSNVAFLNGPNILSAINNFERRVYSYSTANASAAFVVPGIWMGHVGIGSAVDITLRIGLPQLEQGAFATSVIPTSGTAVTRNADVASITGANFSRWYRQDEGTVFAAYDQPAVGGSIAVVDDGTANNAIVLFSISAANQRASSNMLIASANQGRIDAGGTFVANALNKAVLAISANGRGLSCNGSAVATSANPSSMPSLSRLAIQGDSSFSIQKGGHIQRLTYWPQRLPNSTLQNITL